IDRGLNQIDCFKVYIFSILSGFERMKFSYSLVAIAKRSHPFPSRTRKLSSSAPMVVRVRPCESRTLPGFYIIIGGLAQLGEHLPYKQRVGGSIPSSSTICRPSSIGRATDL